MLTGAGGVTAAGVAIGQRAGTVAGSSDVTDLLRAPASA
jgi:hypothetical protein